MMGLLWSLAWIFLRLVLLWYAAFIVLGVLSVVTGWLWPMRVLKGLTCVVDGTAKAMDRVLFAVLAVVAVSLLGILALLPVFGMAALIGRFRG